MLFQEKGQDRLIKKVRTMEIIRCLLIMKRRPNLRKFSEHISMPNKNTEDNYEDRGFWDANCRNFPQQKTLVAYSRHFVNFHKFCHQYFHI